MKNIIQLVLLVLTQFLFPLNNQAQTPNVRSLAGFVFFTANGGITNTGASQITGNVGTNSGAISGFGTPTVLTGTLHIANTVTLQATTDLNLLFNELSASVPTNSLHTPAFGGGETIPPGVYSIAAAGSVAGNLTLDAGGNANAVFIFKFGGAFTVGAISTVHLINGTKECNVFWIAEGAISMAATTDMKGTLFSHAGAVSMAAGGILSGRMLSTNGAISVDVVNNTVSTGCTTCQNLPGSSTWLGVDNDWLNLNNWCGGMPLANNNVTIPASLLKYPVITNSTANFNNINIEAGASLTVSGNGAINLFGSISNAGIFDLTDGTLNLAGPNVSVGGSSILNGTVKNLIISSGAGTSIATGPSNMLSVKNNLSFLTSNNIFTTNGNLTLLSSATTTASVTDITNNGTLTGNSILGNASVERFIPSLKRWRYLAINTLPGTGSKNTVQENWMENQAPGVNGGAAGKGLWVTDASYTSSPGNYDAFSYSPSIKWFNGSAYVGIGNPTVYDIRNHDAYFTYIRGDRGSTAVNGVLSTTVLRTFGNLAQGDRIKNIPAGTNGIGVGNPYASAIDLRKVIFSTNEIINVFVWDPNLGGGYGQGGFQTLSRDPTVDQDFTILPGGGSYGLQSTMNTIESGLGFFIQGSITNRYVTFKEKAKSLIEHNAFRTTVLPQKVYARLSVRETNDSLTMVDAFQVRMASNYNTGLDANDARKKTGSLESVASNREETLLAMEYRNSMMSSNDSLVIKSLNLGIKNYCWTFIISSLNEQGRIGVLVDNYLGTESVLNLDSITNYNFAVTSAVASYNANRFLIIFRQAAVLAVEHIDVAAQRISNTDISINWKVENETDIHHYQTEKSSNGVQFLPFGAQTLATDNHGGNVTYAKMDTSPYTGNNYYRIKAIKTNLEIKYSKIVKITPTHKSEAIHVYPNPVLDKTIHLYLNDIVIGEYNWTLIDENGKTVNNGILNVDKPDFEKDIVLKSNIPAGIYLLTVYKINGLKKSISITILN